MSILLLNIYYEFFISYNIYFFSFLYQFILLYIITLFLSSPTLLSYLVLSLHFLKYFNYNPLKSLISETSMALFSLFVFYLDFQPFGTSFFKICGGFFKIFFISFLNLFLLLKVLHMFPFFPHQ